MQKKPIAVLFSDTHLFERTSKYGTPLNDNYALNRDIYDIALEISEYYELDHIIHLGDIFDFKKHQSLATLLEFQTRLDKFTTANKILSVIPGNHDKVDEISAESYLSIFQHHPNITLYKNEVIVKRDNINYCMFPYFKEEIYKEKLAKILAQLPIDLPNVLLTHQSFNGIEDNEKHVIENGIEVGDKFDAIFSGHIHKRNNYQARIPHYIGSAIPHNFGENEEKGVTLLFNDLSIEFLPLDIIKYNSLDCNINNIDYIYNEAIALKANGELVRVKFSGTEQEFEALNRYDWELQGIKILYNRVANLVSNSINLEIEVNKNIIGMFDDFCEDKKIKDGDKIKGLKYLL